MQTLWYALQNGSTPVTDEYGNQTGEYQIAYANPVECRGNISAARGETVTRQFGDDLKYDRVIVLENANTPSDEYAVLWIESVPQLDESGATQTPWDYVVVRVGRSLNSVTIAANRVTVG